MSISPIEDRYKTEMNAFFTDDAKLRQWMRVEVSLAKAHAKLGHIPPTAIAEIEAASKKVTLARVNAIEAEIHHDLMAMVRALSEQTKRSGGYVHLGATSYDIEDTALALTLREAGQLIRSRLVSMRATLQSLALSKSTLVCAGRTHGQHAVPTTYGMKFALYYTALGRHIDRLDAAIARISFGKMSGATGTMATFGPDAFKLQELVMADLKLTPAPVTSQVIGRDRHAEMIFTLALVAATLEQMAKEIRNLQRTEIGEISEPFGKMQVGSSTMPQKRNPHKSERICSLARVVRSTVAVALENIALEHERDLTNSAAERYIFPDAFITTDYMLTQMQGLLSGLVFFPERIEANLNMTQGQLLAERVMIALSEKGLGRQEAHELLRTASGQALSSKRTLQQVLAAEPKVKSRLKPAELNKLFDPHTYVGQAVAIVKLAVSD